MEGVSVNKAAVLPLCDPQNIASLERKGSPPLLQAPNTSISAWMAVESQCPTKETWETTEEMMGTQELGKIILSVSDSGY